MQELNYIGLVQEKFQKNMQNLPESQFVISTYQKKFQSVLQFKYPFPPFFPDDLFNNISSNQSIVHNTETHTLTFQSDFFSTKKDAKKNVAAILLAAIDPQYESPLIRSMDSLNLGETNLKVMEDKINAWIETKLKDLKEILDLPKKHAKLDLLLLEAFLHTSFAPSVETQKKLAATFGLQSFGYEKLEFLGDSILAAVVNFKLRETNKSVGEMNQIKATTVDNKNCAIIAKKYQFENYIIRSCDIHSNMLGDVFESFIGALFEALGFEESKKFPLFFLSFYIYLQQ